MHNCVLLLLQNRYWKWRKSKSLPLFKISFADIQGGERMVEDVLWRTKEGGWRTYYGRRADNRGREQRTEDRGQKMRT
jgi:hypothetical protein